MTSNYDMDVIEDHKIWKKTVIAGNSRASQKPIEGSTCLLKIENLKVLRTLMKLVERSTEIEFDKISETYHSKILGFDTAEVTLIIGESDCELDKRIERVVQLMKDGEKTSIKLSMGEVRIYNQFDDFFFDVTLMKHEVFKPIWEWTPEEKYNTAMRYKNTGTKLCNEREDENTFRTKDAFYRFSRACKILISLEPINDLDLDKELYDNIQALRIELYNHMAACQARQNNYYNAIQLCSKVLARDDKNVKSLFMRGVAHGSLLDFERAIEDLTKVISINPNYRDARSKMGQYRSGLQKANKRCDEMIKRMFRM